LEQLDLNDNNFSGSINGIGVFPSMKFLQVRQVSSVSMETSH